MERYDMYCQICDRNIYNAMVGWMPSKHYECPQVYDNWEKVTEAYPRSRFSVCLKNGKAKVELLDKSLSKAYAGHLLKHVYGFLENSGKYLTHYCDRIWISVESIEFDDKDFFKLKSVAPFSYESSDPDSWKTDKKSEGTIVWYEDNRKDAYYQKAGLIMHPRHPSNGHHVSTYNICPDCAKKFGYKCNLCGRELRIEKHN